MLVVAEDIPPEQVHNIWYTYPVNAMRNIALDAATTEVSLALDNCHCSLNPLNPLNPLSSLNPLNPHIHKQQMVLLLDGDFVVGPARAHDRLQGQYRELMHVARGMGLVVLPAFKASQEQWGTDHGAELLTWLLSGMPKLTACLPKCHTFCVCVGLIHFLCLCISMLSTPSCCSARQGCVAQGVGQPQHRVV